MHKIYIPTFKRVDEQITLNSIPPGKYKENVILVVQEQELSEHKKARPEFNEDNYSKFSLQFFYENDLEGNINSYAVKQ